MMEPFLQQATMIGTMVLCAVILWNYNNHIKKNAQEQAGKFNEITNTFNQSITQLNIAITKLNATFDFVKKDISVLNNRVTEHGKELDRYGQDIAVLKNDVNKINKCSK